MSAFDQLNRAIRIHAVVQEKEGSFIIVPSQLWMDTRSPVTAIMRPGFAKRLATLILDQENLDTTYETDFLAFAKQINNVLGLNMTHIIDEKGMGRINRAPAPYSVGSRPPLAKPKDDAPSLGGENEPEAE